MVIERCPRCKREELVPTRQEFAARMLELAKEARAFVRDHGDRAGAEYTLSLLEDLANDLGGCFVCSFDEKDAA